MYTNLESWQLVSSKSMVVLVDGGLLKVSFPALALTSVQPRRCRPSDHSEVHEVSHFQGLQVEGPRSLVARRPSMTQLEKKYYVL